jgi:replicative DNA helicase
MATEKNFEYLGQTFQLQLLNQLVIDKEFAHSIIDVIEPTYFENKYFKIILQMIKEYFKKYEASPSFETLNQITRSELPQETVAKVVIDTIKKIKDINVEGLQFVQEKALKFCKQQEVSKAMTKAQKIIDGGEFESYDTIEELFKNALQVGEREISLMDVFSNLDDVLNEDYRHPIPMGIPGIDRLLKGGLAKGEIGVILAPTGVGKDQPISEPVLTPTGWVTMGDIKVGDKVIGSDGKEQYVLGVYPQGVRPMYKVEFSDGTHTFCGFEHLWSVNTLNMRTAKTRVNGKGVYKPNYGYKVLKTSDMMNDIKKRGRYNYRLPVVSPVEFEVKEVPIDPYLLGLLLGDGGIKKQVTLTTADVELVEYAESVLPNNSRIKRVTNTKYNHRITKQSGLINPVIMSLKNMDLYGCGSNNKFIPKDYIYNSSEVRISLLQGLMDTDGYVDKKGTVQFTTVSKQLSEDVRELVLSLGGTVRINTKIPTYNYNGIKKEGQLAYNITISFANNVVPFKLLRKINRYYKRTKYLEQKYVKSITYSHDEGSVCIKVSNPDCLYVTRDYVLTHNTTIMTKVANHAFNLGYNVLQIFFEDNPKIIQRKHIVLWTGIHPDDLTVKKDEAINKVKEVEGSMKNKLILQKYASDTLSMNQIKNSIRKLIADGQQIDMVLLDYIDCVLPDRQLEDEWKSEGSVMRGFEAMCHELSLVGWTATQGNRSSISSEVVTTDQMGGSIKKAQVGHVIISVAKTLQQKEMKLATIAITKSRIGDDGIIFENCKFDNAMLEIDVESSTTFLGHEENKEEERRKRMKELMDKRKEKDQKLN